MLYQLSYFRKNKPHQGSLSLSSSDVCNPDRFGKWEEMDSNHRRRTPADLQSAPFGHSGIFPIFSTVGLFCRALSIIWSRWRDSNPRPRDYKSRALANWATSAFQPFTGCKGRDIFFICKFSGDFFWFHPHFRNLVPYLSTFKERRLSTSNVKVGKSSANIITLSLRKKQLKHFFCKK